MTKKNRSIKVYGMSGYKYQSTPTIMLKGNWLKELGFDIGNYISISCENGKLVITPDTERAELVKAEAEFMERETKALQKRLQVEKEKLHLQFVAEHQAKYGVQRGCNDMGKIILVGATKGGVGKSVSTYNLAYSLASMGKKVLAVDFDSQANLPTCFGVEDTTAVPLTIGHLMMARLDDEELPDPSEYIMNRNGVDFIPSSMVLSAVDAKLRLEMGAERMLANILEPLREEYDYLIIDTCPALGALTINALAAADGVVITVNPQLLAMMGLQEFLKTIKKIKSRINPKLEVEGILLTMCEARTNLCKVISEQVAETFEGQIRIFESKIPSTVKVGESVYYSEPLLEYAPQTKACKAYLDFGKELIGYESKSA